MRTKNNGLSKVAVGAVAKKAQFVPHCGHLTQENAVKRTNGWFGPSSLSVFGTEIEGWRIVVSHAGVVGSLGTHVLLSQYLEKTYCCSATLQTEANVGIPAELFAEMDRLAAELNERRRMLGREGVTARLVGERHWDIFEQERNYVLGDKELEIIGDRDKLAQWRHKNMGPAFYCLGRKIIFAVLI